jgi:hypothetical protein
MSLYCKYCKKKALVITYFYPFYNIYFSKKIEKNKKRRKIGIEVMIKKMTKIKIRVYVFFHKYRIKKKGRYSEIKIKGR